MLTCTFEDGWKANLRHAVADTIVLKNNKILLVKRSKKLIQGGKWALPGGYIDRDETSIQAAAREVLEESGWEVKDLELLSIIDSPNRPEDDRQNISFVFFGQATQKVQEPDWESEEVRWFALDKLPAEEEIAFDHVDIIKLYQRYLAENLYLPIL